MVCNRAILQHDIPEILMFSDAIDAPIASLTFLKLAPPKRPSNPVALLRLGYDSGEVAHLIH